MYIIFAQFTLSQQFVYSIIGFAFANCCKTLRNCNEIEILLAGSAMKRALRENWRVFLPMCVFFCSQCVIRLKISGLRYLDTEYRSFTSIFAAQSELQTEGEFTFSCNSLIRDSALIQEKLLIFTFGPEKLSPKIALFVLYIVLCCCYVFCIDDANNEKQENVLTI